MSHEGERTKKWDDMEENHERRSKSMDEDGRMEEEGEKTNKMRERRGRAETLAFLRELGHVRKMKPWLRRVSRMAKECH